MNEAYWAIKNKYGVLVSEGFNNNNSGDAPILFDDEENAKAQCWVGNGEHPVKVRIVEIEE